MEGITPRIKTCSFFFALQPERSIRDTEIARRVKHIFFMIGSSRSLLHLWFFCTFFVKKGAKILIAGSFLSLQSKKSPDRRFLEVLYAKRNKLLGTD
jgi:hypothetical protein